MKALDPGHTYRPHCYPAREDRPIRQFHNQVQFRKRIGDGYPGNSGEPCDGTTTQELLRVIIDRAEYVNEQDSHPVNSKIVLTARELIYSLEFRAASRRGADYLRQWQTELWSLRKDQTDFCIEDVPACNTCGHILCRRH